MHYDFSIDSKQILLMIRNAFVLDNNSIIKFEQTEDNEISVLVITEEKYNGFSYPKETRFGKVELCFLLQAELNLVNVFASDIDLEYKNGEITAYVRLSKMETKEL